MGKRARWLDWGSGVRLGWGGESRGFGYGARLDSVSRVRWMRDAESGGVADGGIVN